MIDKKTKKKLKISIIVLILILCILLIVLIRENSHKKETILKKLISGLDNLNYTYVINNSYGEEKDETIVQVLGKYEKRVDEEKIEYIDYDKKIVYCEYLGLDDDYNETFENNGITDMDYYHQYIDSYFNNTSYIYQYVGKEKLDNQKCTVVRFEDTISHLTETYLWINDATNLIVRVEAYQKNGEKKEKIMDEKYQYQEGNNQLKDMIVSK